MTTDDEEMRLELNSLLDELGARFGKPKTAVIDLDQEMVSFTAQLRDTSTFTAAAAHWLQRPVLYVSTIHQLLPATIDHAEILDVEVGSEVLYRVGQLQTDPRRTVADVYSVVVTSRLPEEAQFALGAREIPLGFVLQKLGARRENHAVTRIEEIGKFGCLVMQVHASITIEGVPVAAVREDIYYRFFVR